MLRRPSTARIVAATAAVGAGASARPATASGDIGGRGSVATAAAVAATVAVATPSSPMDALLPTAHVCFFALRLPRYSSDAVMRRQLLYAISNCLALDADYRLTDGENEASWDANAGGGGGGGAE